jgi:uncharacterized Zn-finger protein
MRLIMAGAHAYHPRRHAASQARVNQMPIEPPEVVETDSETVACEGIDSALGHPRVFLTIGKEGFVECPYCDRRFVLKAGAQAATSR